MEWEVRWPDGQTERVASDAPAAWDWKCVGNGVYDVRMGQRNVRVEEISGPDATGIVKLRVNGITQQLHVLDRQMLLLESMGMTDDVADLEMEVFAPMPGRVLSLEVAPSQEVQEGDALLVLEAMKMENVIRAPRSGAIALVKATAGQAVEKGAVLVMYEMET